MLLEKLETLNGGSISFSQASKRLGISERELMQKMVAGQVIGVDCDDRYQFPQFQFKGTGLTPGFSEVLSKCVNADPEWVFRFFTEETANGLSPADMLVAGVTEIEMYALIAMAEAEFGVDHGLDD